MSDLFGAAYRGDPSIPHVSEDFFKLVLVSANVRAMRSCARSAAGAVVTGRHYMPQAALLCVSMPGRILGSEVRPRKFKYES